MLLPVLTNLSILIHQTVCNRSRLDGRRMCFQFKWTRVVIVKGQQAIHHANISSPENNSISGTVLAWLGELSSLLSFLLDGPTSSFFVKGEKFGTTCSKGKNMLRC